MSMLDPLKFSFACTNLNYQMGPNTTTNKSERRSLYAGFAERTLKVIYVGDVIWDCCTILQWPKESIQGG